MTNRMLIVLPIIALAVIRFQAPVASAEPLDVCRAVQINSARTLTVRGTGEIGRDGLVVGDTTCPVATSRKLSVPTLITVDIRSYDSVNVEMKYKKLEASENPPLLQILARGHLACRLGFRIRRNESGEILDGNGYGSHGLIKCKLSSARLIQLEEVRQPGPGFERR